MGIFRKFSQILPRSGSNAVLTDSEKQILLRLARASIESAVRNAPLPPAGSREPSLLEPRGVFVTLRQGKELRGCIGYADPVKPLAQTVREVAAKAALEDTRFPPVLPEELPGLVIEISVLSPMIRMQDAAEIELGKHGLMIEYRRRRGLLLPQVPGEYGWDRETFLAQTAKKAGLPPLIWQDPGAETSLFTAEIFDEETEFNT
jgi:AmmeMemoRadiSam system protein A